MKLAYWEKWLTFLWLASAFWTALPVLSVGFTSLIIFFLTITIIGIPIAFTLFMTPTLLLYMTGAAPIYLLFRGRSRLLGLIVSAVVMAIVGVAAPAILNHQIAERFAATTLNDGGGPVEAAKGSVIAYLSDYKPGGIDTECEDYCQRLLFSGVARAVIRGNVSALTDQHETLRRYWFGPAKGRCIPAKLTAAYATEDDVGNYMPSPLLIQKAQEAYGNGQCFFEAKASLGEADLTLAREGSVKGESPGISKLSFDLRPFTTQNQSWIATYQRSGTAWRQIMRLSYANASKIATPLRLDAPFAMSAYSPGGWGTSGIIERGRRADYGLVAFLTNDLRVRGLTTPRGEAIPPPTNNQR